MDQNQAHPWEWLRLERAVKSLPHEEKCIRPEIAKNALPLIDKLRETKYYTKDDETYDQFEDFVRIIYAYANGDPSYMKESVEKYFFSLHCTSGLSHNLFEITFFPKNTGVQTGFICYVKSGAKITGYFLKTHQNGPTSGNPQSHSPPDMKEAFVYKLLHRLGMGPETHLIFPKPTAKSTMYIATKDCKLVLLSNLTEKSASFKALIQLDLISRILCLRDCATNPSNCGQVDDKPMIVDFRIENQLAGYFKPDILDKFYQGNGEFHYVELMQSAIKIPNQEKFEIMKESLKEWDMEANIDEAVLEVTKATGDVAFLNDLPLYVENVKATLKILIEACK
jgi:hypothetical protein